MQSQSSTPLPLPLPPAWQLLTALIAYVYRALSPRTPAMLFRNWWLTTSFFVGNAVHDSYAQRDHSGRRPHFARVHVDLRQQGFFSLAARLARDERLWVDTTWMRELSELVVEDNHSSSNRSLWRRTPGQLARRSRCRSNCTWPFGWVSRWSYLNARLRVL